jgi:hypothetical protein
MNTRFWLLSVVACVACGSRVPASPSGVARGPDTLAADASFGLTGGVFSITNDKGDRLQGTYTGVATFTDAGAESATVELTAAGGTGVFENATGTIAAVGKGAFADEGAFTLTADGTVALASGKRAQIGLTLRGTSLLSCVAAATTASQTAEGTMTRAGRVTGSLSHVVGNSDCSSSH